MTRENAASQGPSSQQDCSGKKNVMLAYGVIQMSATVLSAISLAAIALSLCSIKQRNNLFTGCVDEVIAGGAQSGSGSSLLKWGKIAKRNEPKFNQLS